MCTGLKQDLPLELRGEKHFGRVPIQLKVDCGNHDKHSGAVIPSHFAPDDFLHDPVPSSGEPGA
jgi:hypothetical protein